MFRIITRRRRAETARVDAFLHAIALSERYTVNPEWQLQTVPTDTVAFPRIIMAGTIL